jgi:hypothetical protein
MPKTDNAAESIIEKNKTSEISIETLYLLIKISPFAHRIECEILPSKKIRIQNSVKYLL